LLDFFFVPVAVIGATTLFRGFIAVGTLSPPMTKEPRRRYGSGVVA